jgi:hypothetical protein
LRIFLNRLQIRTIESGNKHHKQKYLFYHFKPLTVQFC